MASEKQFKSIKGTKDLLPEEAARMRSAGATIHNVMNCWGYGEIRTPVFEQTELFARSVGEESDIVSKQMYTFSDQSGTSLTLKPELTAPVMRAYIEHDMGRGGASTKLYYLDTLFRQERPQKGRLRQFHQFGAEAIGSPHSEQDAEIVALVYTILTELGIEDMTLHINSIGSDDSRNAFRQALVEFLAPYKKDLSETSQRRLETNPLRILDSKSEDEQELLQGAPAILDYLDDEDLAHYEDVKHFLERMNIPYTENKMMVRGLDYYTRTTFEITSPHVGAQDALCGGGRYDNLIEDLGGKRTPAVGFAAGIERILLALGEKTQSTDESKNLLYVAATTHEAREQALTVAMILRAQGNTVHFDALRRSLKAQLRDANRLNASHCIIIGEDEMKSKSAQVKSLSSGEQESVPIDSLAALFMPQQ
ncbi:MAG: histidine--tRNA ligase [Candidatus Marinimicrobia bacterium]|nr:histidine--tRNA ligase [Candidatus Neomarinimicrobiota bacterium]MDP6837089.1 histidine--tRNA ligase [Candidatus Neomarinimicrobiota bacterium]|tara:strand:+ start:5697 stop:6965 length:1269 start_codon:yes stop_codon:yes gene_type:complete